jgi:frataxin-like iron-binding protein CyaY
MIFKLRIYTFERWYGDLSGGGNINQIDGNVCCLGVENGSTGMINRQEFIDSKSISNFV